MKKILISDYDGTIFQDDETTKNNIIAITIFNTLLVPLRNNILPP